MLELHHNLSSDHVKAFHQNEIANLFKKCGEISKERSEISCFEEGYIIKKGFVITTGFTVYITSRDVDFIKKLSDEKYKEEVDRIAKEIGYKQISKQIGKIIKWVVNEHYQNEKDENKNLNIDIDVKDFIIGSNKIKIGKNYYKVPSDLLN